jgi:phospholipase/carboxylesterase
MWALAHALPPQWGILTPRAPYRAAAGGYSWIAEPTAGRDSADLFLPALDPLERLLEMHSVRDLVLMGFSQGAAFALSYRLLGKLAPRAWIVIAGYLPRGSWENLGGMHVFWGHGTRDERIPLSRARRDVATLRKGGAAVDLCEAPVGHKLGMECLRGLRRWLARIGLAEARGPTSGQGANSRPS